MTTTKITNVYRRFLNKISDYNFSLLNSEKEVIENSLLQLYLGASPHFIQCKKDLTINFEDTDLIPEGEEVFINSKLTALEEEILSKLMLIEYLKPIMIRNEIVEQVLGDADFNLYSQANHLNQLQSLYGAMKKEVNADIVKYSYLRTGAYD